MRGGAVSNKKSRHQQKIARRRHQRMLDWCKQIQEKDKERKDAERQENSVDLQPAQNLLAAAIANSLRED